MLKELFWTYMLIKAADKVDAMASCVEIENGERNVYVRLPFCGRMLRISSTNVAPGKPHD